MTDVIDASPVRYCVLPNRGVVALTGGDAAGFLNNLVTNSIDPASESRAVYAALLTPQGKFLFDFLIARLGEAILLDTEGHRVDALIRRLSMYRLRASVAIADWSPRFRSMAIVGAATAPAAPPGGLIFPDPRHAGLGWRALVPCDTEWTAPGRAMPFEDYERQRLSLVIPDGSRDMAPEQAILMENGFEALSGVDFKKGCFVGQEVTARTKHRGLVKRRLVAVAIDGPVPPPGTPVTADGHDCGEMRSALGDLGLALIKIEPLENGAALRAGDARLTPLQA